jgi:hypothetical protein
MYERSLPEFSTMAVKVKREDSEKLEQIAAREEFRIADLVREAITRLIEERDAGVDSEPESAIKQAKQRKHLQMEEAAKRKKYVEIAVAAGNAATANIAPGEMTPLIEINGIKVAIGKFLDWERKTRLIKGGTFISNEEPNTYSIWVELGDGSLMGYAAAKEGEYEAGISYADPNIHLDDYNEAADIEAVEIFNAAAGRWKISS